MTLDGWLKYNEKLFYTNEFLITVLKNKSMKKDDILFSSIVKKDVASKYFGTLLLAYVQIGKYPNSDTPCFKLLLWENE